MALLQALMIVFADELINEQDPTRADKFVEKWHRRLRRETRRAQQEDDAVMKAALTPATPAKRVREPSMEHRELERDRVRVDLAGIVDEGAGGWQHA